ncbi:hypothetical protein SAMN04489864_1055 [Pedobacter insulae]|uniref:Uncharacterized protein n=2 Tax=Pedobacter insulae TaxID=414048 RepID=A0A1I2X5H2_9SPHI|nr:hypothetical protein SAMN04489864_1055 [Pedobacter insulae]
MTVLIFFILSNYPPLDLVFHTFTNEGYYKYTNYDGSNIMQEGVHKNYGLDRIKRLHQFWLNKNHEAPDKALYRVFWKNPLAFWRWKNYFQDERYKLPYKDWDEIKALAEKNKSTTKNPNNSY